jgi:hypothetical protein
VLSAPSEPSACSFDLVYRFLQALRILESETEVADAAALAG